MKPLKYLIGGAGLFETPFAEQMANEDGEVVSRDRQAHSYRWERLHE